MRKKSIRKAAETFIEKTDEILEFLDRGASHGGFSKEDTSWCYDLAIIRLYREFEDLMLSCLVALINSDTKTFSQLKGRKFPRHMSVKVCEYLICGDGYFYFSGRSGLIQTIKKVVPTGHYLLETVKQRKYVEALDKLSALRNFAAHDSTVSKKCALEATKTEKMSSSGAWLMRQNRFKAICDSLKDLANKIEAAAPY